MPNIEFMFRGAPPAAALWFPGWKKPYADGYGIRPCLLHPDSRGEVLLRSTDPRDKVKIVTNFFTAPNDLPTLREGFKIAREVAAQPPLAPFRGAETVARAEGQDRRRDRQLDQECRRDRQPSGLDLRHGDRAPTRWSIRSSACMAPSGCAWSMPRRCPTSCPRTSTPAC